MFKLFFIIFLFLGGCGKKGELFLEGKEEDRIIKIDEERIYKF